jgi:hypothetical protein
MAQFVNFSPSSGQTDVARTATIRFTVLEGVTGAQINTLSASIEGTFAIQNGIFINGYNGGIFAGVDQYVVGIYPKSPNFLDSAAQIDAYLVIRDAYNALDSYSYAFFTSGYTAVIPEEPAPEVDPRSCDLTKAFFTPSDLGLSAILDAGVGTEVDVSWQPAYPSNENNLIFYNLYFSTDRTQVFDGYPDFLVVDTAATIGGLPPGDQHFFGVRGAEFNPLNITITGLIQAGTDMYFYPETLVDAYFSATATFISADSVDGFPSFGTILINDELIRYGSKQQSPVGFNVSSGGRGYAASGAAAHSNGALIRLYWGKEDDNTTIAQASPTFQKPNLALTYVLGDGYGNDGRRDGYDGYAVTDGYLRLKQEEFDNITTDTTNNDEQGDFNRFDYCGTWRTMSPQNFLQGQCRNSYIGGAQVRIDGNGDRHLVKVSDFQTHMLQREELLLEQIGEPFVLLRRMWTGARCPCVMLRREHQDARCQICYGVGFVQGYEQFFNSRRADRRILVRVDPTVDDLNIVDRGGLEPHYEPAAWTLPFPGIKDRDILVRFNEDNTEEYRYEILDVTRQRVLFTQTGAQKFRMKRFPKSDIMYQFPVIRDTSPTPGTLTTSITAAPGIVAHSHQLVIPQGINLSDLTASTLENEGHNHVIYNGVVRGVLGHTHTI